MVSDKPTKVLKSAEAALKAVDMKEVETLMTFEAKISHAIMNEIPWVETSTEVLDYFNRRGYGKHRYMIYKGIYVCEEGQAEKIQEALNVDMNRLKHGNKEGFFEGRT